MIRESGRMSLSVLWLQLGAIVLVLLAIVVLPVVYRRLRVRLWPTEEDEAGIDRPRWYQTRPVETGILEVAFALTGVAIALPAFVQPTATTPAAVVWAFQGVLLMASILSASASLLLYALYVRQLAERETDSPLEPSRPSSGAWSWLWRAGPYSLLAYSFFLTLVGLGLLSLIMAYGAR